MRLLLGSHPFPDRRSLEAGSAALAEAARSDHGHLVILVSGGGSALAEVPVDGLTIEQVATVTRQVMDAGVPIGSLNTVRRHLSKLKHGGLLRASNRPVTSLLISDVLDGPATDIASGPSLADGSTQADALAVLNALGEQIDPSVLAILESGTGQVSHPPHDFEVIIDRHAAMGGVRRFLSEHDVEATVVGEAILGAAGTRGVEMVETAGSGYTIATGETTVIVAGDGRGGRNQHAALAVAIGIEGRTDVVFAALGTDGIDGPTDAAGAIVDGTTTARIRAAGIDPEEALARCDSNPALIAAGDAVRIGATGTNVGDLWMVWRAHHG
jgi:hydroxypyruvate reductase